MSRKRKDLDSRPRVARSAEDIDDLERILEETIEEHIDGLRGPASGKRVRVVRRRSVLRNDFASHNRRAVIRAAKARQGERWGVGDVCASSSTVAQDLRLKLLEFSTSVFGAVRDNVELTADRPRDAPMAPLDRALLERVEAAEKEANELAVRVAHAREATKVRVREAIERDVATRLRRLEGEVALPADADSGRKPLVEKKLLSSAAADLAEARRDVDEARRELETRIIAATASLDVLEKQQHTGMSEVEKVLAGKTSATATTPTAAKRPRR